MVERSIRIDADVAEALGKVADACHMTTAELVRVAVADMVVTCAALPPGEWALVLPSVRSTVLTELESLRAAGRVL